MRRLLAHAGLESIADDAIRTVLPIVAVVHLLAGGAYLGVLNALSFVWFLVAHRMIGRWVDRLGGGRAVLVGAVLRTLVTMALLAALLQGTLNPVGLLLVAVALGLGDALATTSFGVLVPQTLGVDRVTAYYSHHEMVAAITRCLAPLLVAWLLGVASPAAVAGWAGALYLVALLVLGRASTVRASSPVPVVDGPADRGSRFGLRHVLRTPGLGGTTLATALQNGAAMATGTVLPLLVIRELGLPAHAVPLLAAVAAAGALLGARLAPRARARWGAGSARWVAAVIAAMVAVLLVAVPALPGGFAWMALLGLEFLAGAVLTLGAVVTADVPVRLVPPGSMGSAFASIRWFTVGSLPMAAFAAGLVVSLTGVVGGLVAAGAASLAARVPLHSLRGWDPRPPEA